MLDIHLALGKKLDLVIFFINCQLFELWEV
jgi:hypothetical protein